MLFIVYLSQRRWVIRLLFGLAFVALVVGSLAAVSRFGQSWVGATPDFPELHHLTGSDVRPTLYEGIGRKVDVQSEPPDADEGRDSLTDPQQRSRPSTDEFLIRRTFAFRNASGGALPLSGSEEGVSDEVVVDDPADQPGSTGAAVHDIAVLTPPPRPSLSNESLSTVAPLPAPPSSGAPQAQPSFVPTPGSMLEGMPSGLASASFSAPPEPSHAPYPPPRRRAGARVLVLMADNRDLAANVTWGDAGYSALAAVANAQFALRHGYDFRYVRLLTDKMFRAASWCKLPIVWGAAGEGYDWVVFADSDAVVREPGVGVDAFLARTSAADEARRSLKRQRRRQTEETGGLASGPPLSSASLVFLADWPYSSLPCAGFFLARGGRTTQDVIRRWWDVNDPRHNLRHAFEQDALWSLWPHLSGPSGSVSTVAEWSFVKDMSPQWVRHISSEEANLRLPYMRSLLGRPVAEGGYGLSPAQFEAALQEVISLNYATLESSDPLTDAMGALTAAASHPPLPSPRPSWTPPPLRRPGLPARRGGAQVAAKAQRALPRSVG